MAKIIEGHRIGKNGNLGIGCSGAVFEQGRILLVKRADNGHWAVPGGYMEPGESVAEACVREVWEESGLRVEVEQLIAVYSTPHKLIVYPDGNQWQLVILHFRARIVGGSPQASDETTAVSFFTHPETKTLDMGELDRQRVHDSFQQKQITIIH